MDEIDADKWYVVSNQGVEFGPYDNYQKAAAKANPDSCGFYGAQAMLGEQVIDTFNDDE